MFHFKALSVAFFTSLALTFSLSAEEKEEEVEVVEEAIANEVQESPSASPQEETIKAGPSVKAKYFSAEAVQAIPRLNPLAKQEPEHNKIIFKLENFPKNQDINLDIKRLASKDPNVFEHLVTFIIQDDNSLIIKDTDQRLQNIISSSNGYLPGERVVYRFSTADGSISKEIAGFPNPAMLKNKDHQVVLKAKLVSIEPTAYHILLPKMENGEEYDLKSCSVGDIVKAKPKYSASKPLYYAPSNGKSKGGDAILEIRKKSGSVYAIRLPWGSSLEGYRTGKKVYSPSVK